MYNRQAGRQAAEPGAVTVSQQQHRRGGGSEGVGEWGGWAVQSVHGPALHRADAALKHNGGIFDDADPSQSRIASVYFLQQTTPGVWEEGGQEREDWQRIH